jgi:hypothetical protein
MHCQFFLPFNLKNNNVMIRVFSDKLLEENLSLQIPHPETFIQLLLEKKIRKTHNIASGTGTRLQYFLDLTSDASS